jgi:hypothetical protein
LVVTKAAYPLKQRVFSKVRKDGHGIWSTSLCHAD